MKNTTDSTNNNKNEIISPKEIFHEGMVGTPEFQHGPDGPPPFEPYEPPPRPVPPYDAGPLVPPRKH